MTETPREYKKRVDEEWIRNGENVNKLIKEIDKYELLDKNYKTVTKQQILENFSKNQKAEKESEEYLRISTELEQIDEKYRVLEEMKGKLTSKYEDKAAMEWEIAKVKTDGVDKTTLNMQRTELNEKINKYKAIKLEIADIEKEITNREQEIQDIESTYWVKLDNRIMEEDLENKKEPSSSTEEVKNLSWTLKPWTLKYYHKQTVGDLRTKHIIVWEIWRLLDEWTWIDEELKDRIKDDVSKKLFKYYDEQHSDLRMKSAKFLKNNIRITSKRLKEFDDISDWSKKEEMLNKIERSEKIYWEEIWMTRLLMALNKRGKDIRKLVDIERCWTIYKPVFKLKNDKWDYMIVWWDLNCWDRYKEIWEIQNIWNKPCFKAKLKNWRDCVIWWTDVLWNWYEEIWEIQNIWNKPCFKAKLKNWRDCVIWWTDVLENLWIKWEIQNIWWKPAFEVIDKKWKYTVYWGLDDLCNYKYDSYRNSGHHDVILEIQNIWWKPCFTARDSPYYNKICYVYWWKDRCWGAHKKVWEIQNIWDKPCFVVYNPLSESVYWWKEQCGGDYYKVSDIQGIWWAPCFVGRQHWDEFIVWWSYVSREYFKVSNVDEVRWKPICRVRKSMWDDWEIVTLDNEM